MDKITVNISGFEFNLKSDIPQESAERMAAAISSGIERVMLKNSRCGKAEAAILTSLNLLEENIKLRNEINKSEEEYAALSRAYGELRDEHEKLKEKYLRG